MKNYQKKEPTDQPINGLYAFGLCIKIIFWQSIDKLKQTTLYQESKIVIN